jgi:hypothetical protein
MANVLTTVVHIHESIVRHLERVIYSTFTALLLSSLLSGPSLQARSVVRPSKARMARWPILYAMKNRKYHLARTHSESRTLKIR